MNCDSFLDGEISSQSQQSNCGVVANLSFAQRRPTTIDKVAELIAALPKPLELHCFIEALWPPLKVFAVNSAFSAQPAAGAESPRIFIIIDKLILSVVPAGQGRDLLELSQFVSAEKSVKAEILFPILQPMVPSAPYARILEGTFGSTSCVFCHQNESRYPAITTGEAYQSQILVPDFGQRVGQDYLRHQTTSCDFNVDPFRCQMLRSIFSYGRAQDTNWPSF